MTRPTESRRTVVIADDDACVRDRLRRLVEHGSDVVVVAEAATADEAARQTRDLHPDALLLDLSMPGTPSLELVPRIRESSPHTAVVALTATSEPGYTRAALRSGVEAYVLKESAATELVPALEAAMSGGTFLSLGLGAAPARDHALPDGLTAREAEVLTLLALGNTNAEVATALALSRRTVESHRSQLQRKTGCRSRSELVRYAIGKDLLHVT